VHILHGLDADLLGLATHEVLIYISREEVVFGCKWQEVADQRRMESGFNDAQRVLDEKVGPDAMKPVD
jgi:5'-3' exonuclease